MTPKRIHPVRPICHYFVDEAGDGTLFDHRGRVIIGEPGCSRYFILGMLDVPQPDTLTLALERLRVALLSDSYLNTVPSMQPRLRKTARLFHAKDDIAEVRRDIFTLLRAQHDLRFYAIVTEKARVVEYVRSRNQKDSSYRYNPNELYDFLVRRLFVERLHRDEAYRIHFAKRGRSDRTIALQTALRAARQRFFEKWNITSDSPMMVIPTASDSNGCLQAADYFLWALQRFYELGEDRYLNYLWPSFRLVQDLDDCREAQYGMYYTQRKPLTRAALEGRVAKSQRI